jgi:3-oxoacyl-[acyl-carrier protein] reductase
MQPILFLEKYFNFAINKIKKMGLLIGKVALITGGSRGIGEAIVRSFASEGAHVVFTYMSSSLKADGIAAELSNDNQRILAVKSDASNFQQAEELISLVIKEFGQIDILINNAGITRDTLMLRMNEQQWDEVMEVNLKSVFNLTKHALRPMLKQRSGSIINMGSVVGVFGNAGQANYAASKAGIIGFSKSIAKEVGSRGIRCNVIAPGFIATDMTDALTDEQRKAYEDVIPLKVLGSGEDVANACKFLGSDMGKYVTGQVISVCGGLNI